MRASVLRFGMRVDGRRVQSVSRVTTCGRQLVRVRFADGAEPRDFWPDQDVTGVQTSLTIAAGPVNNGWFVASKPKVRVTDGVWAGEKSGSRREQMIAVLPAFNR